MITTTNQLVARTPLSKMDDKLNFTLFPSRL